MKKHLFYLLFIAASIVSVNSFAQYPCNGGPNNCGIVVGNTVVSVKSTSVNPQNASQIIVNFDVAFDLSYNNGNTDFFINAYLANDYPSYWPCGNGNIAAPKSTNGLGVSRSQSGRSFMDIQLSNPARGAVGVPVNMPIASTYQYDNTVELTSPGNSPGMVATKVFLSGTTDRVSIQNVTVIINAGINDVIAVKADVWAQNGNAHCYQAGISQFFNDPKISGFKTCSNPRTYNLGISTADPVSKSISYKVYVDMNDNGSLDLPGDVLAFTSGTVNISSGSGFSASGATLPAPYSNTQPYSEKGYLILVEGATLANSVVYYMPAPSGCIGLPVGFTSFNAVRSRSTVSLKWETAFEQNNTGFAVERNTGNGWQEIGFVATQAQGGNSSEKLSYVYNDLNTTKGISQYRLRQVDLDGKSKNSEIRAVKGEGQSVSTIVYPNPSSDGKVNIVFDETNVTRNVSVIDMSGRVIKQWRNITNNNLQVDNLSAGIYSVRIVAVETGEQSVEKIVINKR